MQQGQYNYKRMTIARAWLGLAAMAGVGALVAASVLSQGHMPAGTAGAAVAVLTALLAAVLAVSQAGQSGLAFEYGVRRRFRAVCREKGLTKRAPRGDALLYPPAGRLSGSRDGFSLTLRPLAGQSLADYERAAPAFSLAYAVSGVRFRNNGDGTLTMQAGHQKIAAHDFAPYPVTDLSGLTPRQRLGVIQLGTAEGGRPWLLRLIDSHTLVAGITGAGKGSVIWSALLRLVPEVEAGTVRLWGFDPKGGMELGIGRGVFHRFASAPEELVELLEAAHDDMQARALALAGWARRFEPSTKYPLHVLVVDELGYLAGLPDRKLRERAERALTGILMLGRAVGFSVIGALQDPRKETLGYRDLFPTRVAMRLPKPMVDLVLGHGMYEAGAQCDLIPAGEAGAGVAFVVDEASTQPLCVRASWCSDEAIRAAASRLLPTTSTPEAVRLRAVN